MLCRLHNRYWTILQTPPWLELRGAHVCVCLHVYKSDCMSTISLSATVGSFEITQVGNPQDKLWPSIIICNKSKHDATWMIPGHFSLNRGSSTYGAGKAMAASDDVRAKFQGIRLLGVYLIFNFWVNNIDFYRTKGAINITFEVYILR